MAISVGLPKEQTKIPICKYFYAIYLEKQNKQMISIKKTVVSWHLNDPYHHPANVVVTKIVSVDKIRDVHDDEWIRNQIDWYLIQEFLLPIQRGHRLKTRIHSCLALVLQSLF